MAGKKQKRHPRKCTGHSKRSGKLCESWAMKGKSKCAIHGGKSLSGKDSPTFKHGLFSKYPEDIAKIYIGPHMDAAQAEDPISLLKKTIPVAAAILSTWVEKGLAFLPGEHAATAALFQRLTKMVDTYEKLTNPELRTGKLVIEHDYKDKSDGDLLDEIAELHKEAEAITRAAATREGKA